MLLPPQRARLNIVQACDVCAPRHLDRHLAKLGILLHHGRDDTEEGFVRGEEAGTTRKRIPLKQALKSYGYADKTSQYARSKANEGRD